MIVSANVYFQKLRIKYVNNTEQKERKKSNSKLQIMEMKEKWKEIV